MFGMKGTSCVMATFITVAVACYIRGAEMQAIFSSSQVIMAQAHHLHFLLSQQYLQYQQMANGLSVTQ